MDVPIYFWYTCTIILLYKFVYHIFITSRCGWLLVPSLYKEDYLHNFDCVSFWLQGYCG